jgi:hypothetical protein
VLLGAGLAVAGTLAADAPRAFGLADGRGAALRPAVVDQGWGAGLGMGSVPVSAALEGAGNVRMALSGGPQALHVALTVPDAVAATARARGEDLAGALAEQGVRLAVLSVSAGGAAQGAMGERGPERGPERGSASEGGGAFQSEQRSPQRGQAEVPPGAAMRPRGAARPGLAAVDETALVRPQGRAAERFA